MYIEFQIGFVYPVSGKAILDVTLYLCIYILNSFFHSPTYRVCTGLKST